jgi:hypothetical protein
VHDPVLALLQSAQAASTIGKLGKFGSIFRPGCHPRPKIIIPNRWHFRAWSFILSMDVRPIAAGSMIKNMTIRFRITISFVIVLLVMTLMVIVVYTRLGDISAETTSVEADSLPSLYYAIQLQTAWTNEHALLQEHILQEEPAAL